MRIDQRTMRNLRGGGKAQDWQIWQQHDRSWRSRTSFRRASRAGFGLEFVSKFGRTDEAKLARAVQRCVVERDRCGNRFGQVLARAPPSLDGSRGMLAQRVIAHTLLHVNQQWQT